MWVLVVTVLLPFVGTGEKQEAFGSYASEAQCVRALQAFDRDPALAIADTQPWGTKVLRALCERPPGV